MTCTAAVAPAQTRVSAIAGNYRVVSWTTAEGLPQNTVNDIALLPNGELWLSTFGGLARFDGQTFRVVDLATDSGLPDNRLLSLLPSGADSFWFLTHQGHVGRIAQGQATTLIGRVPESLNVLALEMDGKGRAYVRSVDGALWTAPPGASWTRLLPGRRVSGVLRGFGRTEEGALWAAMGDRFVELAGGATGAAVDVPSDDYGLFRRVGGGLWVGTSHGLAEFDGHALRPVDVRPEIPVQVTAIDQARPDVLWVASRGEVSRLERQPAGWWRRETLPLALPRDHFVRSLRLDARGNVWVGTTGLGLFRLDLLPLMRVGADGELGAAVGLAADGAGGAFVVDWCRGVAHVSPAGRLTRVPIRAPDVAAGWLDSRCSMALASRTPGSAWLRVEDRLFVVERDPLGVVPVRASASLPSGDGSLAPDGAGGLIVTSRGGLVQQLSAKGEELRRWTLPAPVVSATVAPDATVWIGGDGRVFRLAGDAVSEYGAGEGVPKAEVRDIVAQRDGTAWLGTYGGGVGRFVGGHVTPLTVANGLPDNAVSRILADARGRFWIATNRGIAVVPADELKATASGQRSTVSPVVFGPERGVGEATFGHPAGFADGNGVLWFGTIAGALAIDTGRFPFSTQPPRARVEAVTRDGVPVPFDGSARVPAGTSRLRIEFSAFPVAWPEQVRFRFRLEGVDRDWVDTGTQRTVDLALPDPGRYRLLVQARNEDGIWSATPATLGLDVEPAWWQTVAFRASTVATGALILFGGFRLRLRSIERRHGERLRAVLEQRQSEARIAELRAQLDHVSRVALAGELAASLAHEVSQPLAAMVYNAEAGRRRMSHYVERPQELESLLDDIVSDGMRASAVMKGLRAFLRPRATEMGPVDLSAVVREMLPLVDRELRQSAVVLDLALAPDLPPVDGVRVQLGQVVVNLLRNAWEAMAATTGERRLQVSTRAPDGRVELHVRDHGPGLSRDVAPRVFEPFVTTKAEGLGMGLAICRAIAEAHGGHLVAAAAEPGLEVVLSLPAGRRVKEA